MKNIIFIVALLACVLNTSAQAESEGFSNNPKLTVGFEIDVVPYITGGYYASVWVGFKELKQRVRPVASRVNIPGFLYNDTFSRNTINSYGIFTDYFFKPGFEKYWIATGIEYWDGEIEDNFKNTGKYNEWVFTLGFGYVWNFHKNFYLTPWIAGNIRIAGDEEIIVGEVLHIISLVTPELSLKIGWHF
jgi:hypothetical protein